MAIKRKTAKPVDPPIDTWEVYTDDGANLDPHIATIKMLGDNQGFTPSRPIRVIDYWASKEDTGGWYPNEARLLAEALLEAAEEAERRLKR